MHEHHDRSIGRAGGHETIEDLPRMRAIGDVTRHRNAALGRTFQHWAICAQHHVSMFQNVVSPHRADLHHLPA